MSQVRVLPGAHCRGRTTGGAGGRRSAMPQSDGPVPASLPRCAPSEHLPPDRAADRGIRRSGDTTVRHPPDDGATASPYRHPHGHPHDCHGRADQVVAQGTARCRAVGRGRCQSTPRPVRPAALRRRGAVRETVPPPPPAPPPPRPVYRPHLRGRATRAHGGVARRRRCRRGSQPGVGPWPAAPPRRGGAASRRTDGDRRRAVRPRHLLGPPLEPRGALPLALPLGPPLVGADGLDQRRPRPSLRRVPARIGGRVPHRRRVQPALERRARHRASGDRRVPPRQRPLALAPAPEGRDHARVPPLAPRQRARCAQHELRGLPPGVGPPVRDVLHAPRPPADALWRERAHAHDVHRPAPPPAARAAEPARRSAPPDRRAAFAPPRPPSRALAADRVDAPARQAPFLHSLTVRSGAVLPERAVDLAIVGGLIAADVVAQVVVSAGGDARSPALGLGPVLVAAVCAAPFWWRRRYPISVLVAVLVLVGVAHGLVTPGLFTQHTGGPVVLSAYAVGSWAERRARAAVVGAVVLAVVFAGTAAHAKVADAAAVSLVLVALPGVAGHAARTRRLYTDEVERRLSEAERDRDLQAERAVLEERRVIARELHDVVAHHVGLIGVQAGAAR